MMQATALALTLILFPVSAWAHGPGADFVVVLVVVYALAVCVVTVPVAMLLPNVPKGDRIAIGVCVALAAGVAGVVAGALLPGLEDWLVLGVPLLAGAALLCHVVVERWRAKDPWPFFEPTSFSVHCSRAILEGGGAVALVEHARDGSWKFLDIEPVRPGDEPAHVRLEDMYRIDPTVAEVADLAPGWRAERSGRTMPWSRAKIRT